MFQIIENDKYLYVYNYPSSLPDPNTTASSFYNSIASIKHSTMLEGYADLPRKCLIVYPDKSEQSSFHSLEHMDYYPRNAKWSYYVEEHAELYYTENDEKYAEGYESWTYKNSTIAILTTGLQSFKTVTVSPPVSKEQEFNSLEEVFKFVEKREDSIHSGTV
ncbi:hypothetical protein [Citrobacter portucalensis]|uniref:hypothetical protein n=1 Tax=Citrobacter portucalensis TaxID=1639133 RepID=UPI00226B1955|nr:hypothetical protein [Citrobacter portucalensis]MCX8986042.1 hypothetical protein [Citrobacter portucalensis]